MSFHVIDLSHVLKPGQEGRGRRLEATTLHATEITGAPPEEQWYIMHRVQMDNHIGTHIEVPYHAVKGAPDMAQVPVEQLVGEAVIVDLRGYSPGQAIPLADLQRAVEKAGGVHQGDIVFCMTGWSQYYGSDKYSDSPFITREGVRWLVGLGIKMLGIDTGGRIDTAYPDRSNHLILFEAGVPYIESLTNLAAIPRSRIMVAALAPAIVGMEAFPVRVIALA